MKTKNKTKGKLISYVLGIYNADRTLKECLASIFMQDIKPENYEVIIVDGGSNDKTLEIVNSFQKKYKNIKLIRNPYKSSEGTGMGKEQGINASSGKYIALLDHDNILINKNWTKEMLVPFCSEEIMASQSLLKYRKNDSLFLKYVNGVGVEDPFAVPYSLVAQVQTNPKKFAVRDNYYIYQLNSEKVLFGGANGCIFRKEVFVKIGGYTRDVDVFARMAKFNMKIALPKNVFVYHATSANFQKFIVKKGIYFYRFINKEYKTKDFNWIGKSSREKLNFFIRVFSNLLILPQAFVGIKNYLRTGENFWILHSFYVFFVTIEYGIITLSKIRNFFEYSKTS